MNRAEHVPLRAKDGAVCAFAVVDPSAISYLLELPWHRTHYGYAGSRFKREALLMHRIVLDLKKGDGWQVDHINGDRLDNRTANLRVVTAAQNRQNQRKTRGSSRFRGVSLHMSGRWVAQAKADGINRYLGLYDTEEEAAEIVARFRAKHMPFSLEAR